MPEGVEWHGGIAFLDRDGVLNIGSEAYVKSLAELAFFGGEGHCVGRLRRAGYRIVIVTNQSPVNRGILPHDDLAEIHAAVPAPLLAEDEDAHLDLILYSPYAPWEGSEVRKPGAGMLRVGRQLLAGEALDALRKMQEPQISFMAGDRDADMGAAWHAGVRAFRVDPEIGIESVIERVLKDSDLGDYPEILS